MRVLDLFCGAGGAAMGYYRAFGPDCEIVGVDIKPQPRYPFTFVLGDALEYCAAHGAEFDFIHASPPCQRYSHISHVHGASDQHPDLVATTRDALKNTGRLYVIENVVGAPLVEPVILCGTMFGLGAICRDGKWRQLWRHRLFESDAFMIAPTCQHDGEPVGVYGNGGGQAKTVWSGGPNRGYMGTHRERVAAMGIDWMRNAELSQAIPPAYTEWIGRQLFDIVHTHTHTNGGGKVSESEL